MYFPFRQLALTIWSPARAFAEIKINPAWLGAFLIIGLGSAGAACITLPIFQKTFLLSLSEPLMPDQLEQISRTHRTMRYVYVGGTFAGLLIMWFISAFLIWLLVQVFEGRSKFKPIFSVIAHANVVALISGILLTTALYIKSRNGTTDFQSLEIKLGADLFVSSAVHPALKIVLANLNPFTFWYYALLAIGIATVCEFNRGRAVGVVVTFWAISTTFSAGIAWVLSAFQSPGIAL